MKQYIAIDLKSFYASVECVERGLDPLRTRLVVADESRTSKTICLAVSPALKAYGIPGRARLFEVNKKAADAGVDFIVAKPRMALYMEYSTKIYDIYLKYVSKEDMHVYSVDEVFIDITSYLHAYNKTAEEMAITMINDVFNTTGITATAGIGTNMYLAKIAMDIVAKHAMPDENGVRMASLDEMSYRRLLWDHQPLSDFWRIGKGIQKRLASVGIYTMGEVALCALGKETDFYNKGLLRKLLGVNAELLIDHAFGYEPCTIEHVKNYRPQSNSLSLGQVLKRPYEYEETRLIVKEMSELLSLGLVNKSVMTKQLVLTIGYDIENLTDAQRAHEYKGEVNIDRYGRKVPKHAHGTKNLNNYTSSSVIITEAMVELFDRIYNPMLLSRRITVVAAGVIPEAEAKEKDRYVQMDLFKDFGVTSEEDSSVDSVRTNNTKRLHPISENEERQRKVQQAALKIKDKYGKNAILKGMNLQDGGTTIERNAQIGGHKA